METNRSKGYDPVVQSQSADAPALGSQGLRLGALPKVKNHFLWSNCRSRHAASYGRTILSLRLFTWTIFAAPHE